MGLLTFGSAYPELNDTPQPLWTFTLFAYALVLILPPSLWNRAPAALIATMVTRALGLLSLIWAVGANTMEAASAGDLFTPLVLSTWVLPIFAAASVLEVLGVNRLRAPTAAQPSVAADAPQASRR